MLKFKSELLLFLVLQTPLLLHNFGPKVLGTYKEFADLQLVQRKDLTGGDNVCITKQKEYRYSACVCECSPPLEEKVCFMRSVVFLQTSAVLFVCKCIVQVKQCYFCGWNLVPVELMLLLTSVQSKTLHESLRSRSQTQGGESLDKLHCRQSHL